MLDYRVATFLEVYRDRSYTKAARALLITQPAVSQHIRQLEAHYGCTLFAKTGRAIQPTPAADLLFEHLSCAANDEERLIRETRSLGETPRSARPLRFGCTLTIADFAATRILPRQLAAHPDEHIDMRVGNTHILTEEMLAGAIDFALVEGGFDMGAFDSEVLSREPYVAIAAPGSAAGRAHGTLRELLAYPLILREAGSGTREILMKHLAAREISVGDFASTIELASIPAIKACARAGLGVSFIYRTAVADELAAGTLADVTPADFSVEHDFRLIWQRHSRYAERWRALARTWSAWYAQGA